ncbi:MAG: AAA family ATPase [Magnetococcales bacterium]|nr:AAA family ATPase [Magnetococcales bacterium]
MEFSIPKFSLVLLIGVSSSGKSTFARKHFKRTEILSSDFFRGLVADDENDQGATRDAFEVLMCVAKKRLSSKRLTVIDATNVEEKARRKWHNLSREIHCPTVAILLNLPIHIVEERHAKRDDRNFPFGIITKQFDNFERSIFQTTLEEFDQHIMLSSIDEINNASFTRK